MGSLKDLKYHKLKTCALCRPASLLPRFLHGTSHHLTSCSFYLPMVLFSPTTNVNSPRLRFGAVLLAAGSSEPVVHGWCSVNGCWVTDWMESPQCLLCIPTTQPFILLHPDNFNNLLTVSLPTNPRPFTCPWLVFLFGNIFFVFCSASSYPVPWEYGLVFSFK